MKKSVLLGIAVLALLAFTAFAGEVKVDKPWPITKIWTPQKVTTVGVWFEMPYFVKIWDQPIKIQLVQQDTTTFEGIAKDKDGHVVTAKANFDANLSTQLVLTAKGSLLQGNTDKWSHSVTPNTLLANTDTVLTIKVGVIEVNLMAWATCTNEHVADCEIWVVPTAAP